MAADSEAHSPEQGDATAAPVLPEHHDHQEPSGAAESPTPAEPPATSEPAEHPAEAEMASPTPSAPELTDAVTLEPAEAVPSAPDLLHATPYDPHAGESPHNGHDSLAVAGYDDGAHYGPPAIPPSRPPGRAPEPDEDFPDEEDGGGAVKSFLEHLEDLRWMIIKAGASALVGIVVCLLAGNHLVEILKVPLIRAGPTVPPLANFQAAGPFYVAFQLAIIGGIILASPFIFYFVLEFVLPALKVKEKKYFFRGLFVGGLLFFTGVTFCYWFLMPVALKASVQYAKWLGINTPFWEATEFFGFITKFMLGMGLGFELPVVLLILVKLNILSYSLLSKGRRYMIVINLVLGAVLTTPEIVTQVLMALPLQLLYEATIWIAWYWEKQEKKKAGGG